MEDNVEEAEDNYDQSSEIQDGQEDTYGGMYPAPAEKSDQYNFFGKILKIQEPNKIIKVANLNSQEIGDHRVSIRDGRNLALLGRMCGHDTFGQYWEDIAVINAGSSMSKKGWFLETTISQKRVRERSSGSGGSSPLTKSKWRLFSKKTPPANIPL